MQSNTMKMSSSKNTVKKTIYKKKTILAFKCFMVNKCEDEQINIIIKFAKL